YKKENEINWNEIVINKLINKNEHKICNLEFNTLYSIKLKYKYNKYNIYSNDSNIIHVKTFLEPFKLKKNEYNLISNNDIKLISNYKNFLNSVFGDVILNNEIYQCKLTVNKKNGLITPNGIGLVEESFNEYCGRNCHTGKNQRCIIYYYRKYDTDGNG